MLAKLSEHQFLTAAQTRRARRQYRVAGLACAWGAGTFALVGLTGRGVFLAPAAGCALLGLVYWCLLRRMDPASPVRYRELSPLLDAHPDLRAVVQARHAERPLQNRDIAALRRLHPSFFRCRP